MSNHNVTCRVTSHSLYNGIGDADDLVSIHTDGDFGSVHFTTSKEAARTLYSVGTSLIVQIEVVKEEPDRRPMDEFFREVEEGDAP